MDKESPEEYTIESDSNLRESGVQGGKIIGEHLALGCFLLGIPFLLMGVYALVNMVFCFGYPTNTALLIGVLLIIVIGTLLIIGGYTIQKTSFGKKEHEMILF